MKNTTTTTNTTTPGGNRGYNGIAAAVSARAALPVQPRFCGADDARSLRRRPPQHQAPTLPNRGPLPQAPAFPVDPAALAPPASPRMPDGTQYIDHCAPHAPRAQLLGAVAIYDALTGTRLPFRDSSGAPLPLAFIQQARVVNGHDVIRQAASAAQAPLDEIHAWVEIGGVSCRVLPYNYIDEVVLNPLTRRNEFGHVAVYVYREAPAGTRREVQGLCSGCHRAQEAIQMMRVTEQQLEWRELADAQDRVAANVQRGCTPAFVAKLRAWHGELTEACAVLVRSLRSTHCSCHGDGACDAGHPLHAEHWLDLYVRGLVPEPYAVGVAAEAGVTRAQDAARWHRLEQIGELPPLSGVVMLGVVPQRRTRRAPATANTSSPAATGSATATDIVSSTTADTTPVAPPPSRAASLTAEDANNGGGDTEGAAASLAMEVASESDGDTSSSDGASEEPPAQQDAEDAEEAEAAVDDCSTDGAESDVGEPDEAAAHSVVEAVLSSVFGDEDDDGAPAASSASLVGGCSLPHAAEVQRLFCGHDDATAAPSTSRDESSGSATPNNRRPKAPAAAVFSESPAGSPTRENAAATMDAPGPVKERAAAAAPQAAPSKPTAPPTTAAAKRAAEKEKSRQRRAAQAAREAEAQAEKKAAKAKAAAARASKQAAREAEEDALLTKAAATTAAAASAASTTTASTTAAADESRNNSPMWFSTTTASAKKKPPTSTVAPHPSRSCSFCLSRLFFAGQTPLAVFDRIEKLRAAWCGGCLPGASFVPDFDYPGSDNAVLILVSARSNQVDAATCVTYVHSRYSAFRYRTTTVPTPAQIAGYIIDSVILAFAFFDRRCPHCNVNNDSARHTTSIRGAMSMLWEAGDALRDPVAQKFMRAFSCGLRTIHAARLLSRVVQVLWDIHNDDASTRRRDEDDQQQPDAASTDPDDGAFTDGPFLHGTVAPLLNRLATALLSHRARLVEKSGPDDGCMDLDDVVTVSETIAAALPHPVPEKNPDIALAETLEDLHAAEHRHFPAASCGAALLQAAVALTDAALSTEVPISPLHSAAITIASDLLPPITKFSGATPRHRGCDATMVAQVYLIRDFLRGVELYGPTKPPRIVTSSAVHPATADVDDDADDDYLLE